MGRRYKDEIDHEYGPYIVTGYTTMREKSNKCVIWEVRCKTCGCVRFINGNHLRFDNFSDCPRCGRRD